MLRHALFFCVLLRLVCAWNISFPDGSFENDFSVGTTSAELNWIRESNETTAIFVVVKPASTDNATSLTAINPGTDLQGTLNFPLPQDLGNYQVIALVPGFGPNSIFNGTKPVVGLEVTFLALGITPAAKSNKAVIIGSVIGVVAFLVLVGVAFIAIRRRKTRQKTAQFYQHKMVPFSSPVQKGGAGDPINASRLFTSSTCNFLLYFKFACHLMLALPSVFEL